MGCILIKVNPNNHAVMIESTVYGENSSSDFNSYMNS
jgi:hypothetical protein